MDFIVKKKFEDEMTLTFQELMEVNDSFTDGFLEGLEDRVKTIIEFQERFTESLLKKGVIQETDLEAIVKGMLWAVETVKIAK